MKKQRIAESMKVLVETGPGETGGGNMYSKLAIKYSKSAIWKNFGEPPLPLAQQEQG